MRCVNGSVVAEAAGVAPSNSVARMSDVFAPAVFVPRKQTPGRHIPMLNALISCTKENIDADMASLFRK
jgi:hypothetical protein